MNDESNKQVSVIIPVFNGEHYLAQAIESVLAQKYSPLELIIVDDGSIDGSAEIARRFSPFASYIHQNNQGSAPARNAGVNASKGEILAFLDADDLWLPQKLTQQVALLQQQRDALVVCHFHSIFEPDVTWPIGLNRAYYESDPVCFLPSGLLLARTTWEQIGQFDPHYRVSEDTEWFFRARRLKIPEGVVPEVLVHKRFHKQNLSLQATGRELLHGLHASLHHTRR